jgi:hypothetical protein
MTNPELRRNLWLSFSLHRLIGMPALLGLVFMTAALSATPGAGAYRLYNVAAVLFMLVVWGWGGFNASASITDEWRDKTWDQQRMSALGPWTMTWGKLLGATSFNWYGGAICLLVLAFSGIAGDRPGWPLDLLLLIVIGVLIHAAMIASALRAGRSGARFVGHGGAVGFGILFVFVALQGAQWQINADASGTVFWWGLAIGGKKIVLLESAALFTVCAAVAAWRLMSNALQVRTWPWALPSFALILAVYLGGFNDRKFFGLTGFFVALTFSYATLLTEPNTPIIWNKLSLRLQTRDWRGLLADLPLWPATFALTLVFAVAVAPAFPFDLPRARAGGAFLAPLAMTLLLLRDAGIVLFFSFAPHARRPVVVAVLYMAVLNFLLPFFFEQSGLHAIAWFFNPYFHLISKLNDGSGVIDLLITGIHTTLALGLAGWRFNRGRRQAN